MEGILLTRDQGMILGPISLILGKLLNFIFNIFPNVGVSIIIFTVVIYICLLPLTYKQQKFSKLSAKMNPEIRAIQEKYKGLKDQESMVRQNEEMQTVYKKYGVSPTGSCVQLIIQMPILFALYRVINSIPAYVDRVFYALSGLAQEIINSPEGIKTVTGLDVTNKLFKHYINNGNFNGENALNSVIDVLNKASSSEWDLIGKISGIDTVTFDSARESFERFNNFLGLNIAQSPMYIIKSSFETGNFLLVIGAIMVPALAALTQWMNTLFMPQSNNKGGEPDAAQSMMKSMNITMPLMSAFFCISLPCGMGLYWISGAVIRCVEQVIINKRIDKMDLDALIEKNIEKNKLAEKKMAEVSGKSSLSDLAKISTKNIGGSAGTSDESGRSHANPGSIAAKANMVKEYNEKKS
ncbi:MAG: YidC/Oxa1 family membrane protein insertase [Lachnospiraceae bacterium]|nr:YidC/Oxa1 family membrane protein insertase [Lachnospiraceae bacterium]